MNPLEEIQAIIERLLFRIGDEQQPMPDQVMLVVVSGDQSARYLIQSGTPTTTIFANIITADVTEDGDAD